MILKRHQFLRLRGYPSIFGSNPIAISEWQAAAKLWNRNANNGEWTADFGAGWGRFWKYAEIKGNILLIDRIKYQNTSVINCKNFYIQRIIADARTPPINQNKLTNILALGLSEYITHIEEFLTSLYELSLPNSFLLISNSPPKIFNKCRQFVFPSIILRNNDVFVDLLEKCHWSVMQNCPINAGWQSIFAARRLN